MMTQAGFTVRMYYSQAGLELVILGVHFYILFVWYWDANLQTYDFQYG